MDYGVKYSITVGGSSAVAELNTFLKKVNQVTPAANARFKSMTKEAGTLLTTLRKIRREMQTIKSTKLKFDARATLREINAVKKKLSSLKDKTVKVTVKEGTPRGGRSAGGRGASRRRFGGGRSAFGRVFSPTSAMSAGGIPFATTLGAGIIGMSLRSIISEASKFQHTMVSVRAILRATDTDAVSFNDRFDKMSKSMRTLGVDTKFTATEIADATRFLAMAGMNVETIEKSMKSITNLAAIGDTDLGNMADIVTNIMTGYGITSDYIAASADNLAAVTSRSNVNVLEMGESMKYASNYMRMAGIDFSEGAAAVGILGNAGIKGSRAGTSLRAMLIRMIKPTKKAQAVIDRLGLSFTHMVTEGGKTREVVRPLEDIFQQLKTSKASMQDITAIFDKIGGGAAMALVDNVGLLRELTKYAQQSGGLADFLAEEKMKTVVGLSQQLKSKFLDLGQTLFNNIAPKLEKMMGNLLSWMKTEEADKMFLAIQRGLSRALDALKGIAVFIKNNWNWLQYIFGGMIAKSVIGGGIVRLVGGGRAIIGGLARIGYSFTNLASVGAAATTTIGSVAASLGAVVAGGVVAAGVGLIAYKVYDLYTASKRVSEIRDEALDWSMKTVGVNTEGLDIIQKKLDGIYYTKNKIDGIKKEGGDASQKAMLAKYDESIKAWQKLNSWRLWGDKKTGDVLQTVKNIAISGKRGKNIKDIWTRGVAGDGVSSLNESVAELKRLNDVFSMDAADKSRPSIRRNLAGRGFFSGVKGYNEMIGSIESAEALRDFSFTLQHQLQMVSTSLGYSGPGKNIKVLEALDALLGDKMNLGGFIEDMKGGLYTKPEDIKNRLSARSLSAIGIRTTLANMGVGSALIDKLIKGAGIAPALDSRVRSTGAESNVTSADGDGDGFGSLSGAGKLAGRTGKAIIVNIDKLWNVETANFKSEEDLEAAKDKIATALMDVVKDYEISNF